MRITDINKEFMKLGTGILSIVKYGFSFTYNRAEFWKQDQKKKYLITKQISKSLHLK
jgi:hypothetical protein